MDPIPDHWPPDEASTETQGLLAPLFPLPGVFLFPRQLMPLHIFERRYRQMVEDILDTQGRIVMGTLLQGRSGDPPSVLPVAGLGEIVRHEKTAEDRYEIMLLGLARVLLVEAPSERLYRRVRVRPLVETQPEPADSKRLHRLLYEALHERFGELPELPDQLPTAVITDLLSQRLKLPQSVMEEIFSESDITRRAELTLEAHSRYPND